MLLDEADVFLENRGHADMRRNAVVAVFLRMLEYYSGILILTYVPPSLQLWTRLTSKQDE